MEKNESEWTGKVEISKEKNSNRRSMHGFSLTYSELGQPLSYVFSTEGNLISAFAVPHSGGGWGQTRKT